MLDDRRTQRLSPRGLGLALALGIAFALGWQVASIRQPAELEATVPTGEAELETVANQILDEPDTVARTRRLLALVGRLPAERFPELARVFDRRAPVPRTEDIGVVMFAWARLDPEAALDQGMTWRRSSLNWGQATADRAVGEPMYAWAQDPDSNPERAIADAPGSLKALLTVAMMRGWVESDQIPRATNFLKEHPSSSVRQILTSFVAERIAQRHGPEAVIGWAEALPAGTLRRDGRWRSARAVARLDLERGRSWVESAMGAPDTQGMAGAVALEWSLRDAPTAALKWIDTLPDEGERRDAGTQVVGEWLRRAPNEALAWLHETSPLDMMYRPILVTHVRGLFEREGPSPAIAWAGGVADPDRRLEVQRSLGRFWLERDPEAAREWLGEVGLLEEVEVIMDRAAELRARQAQAEAKAPTDREPDSDVID